MANHPPFAALNHVASDSGIPGESGNRRIGISVTVLTRSASSPRIIGELSGFFKLIAVDLGQITSFDANQARVTFSAGRMKVTLVVDVGRTRSEIIGSS